MNTPDERCFTSAICASGVENIASMGYALIEHALLTTFSERWHSETSNFHISVKEMTVTSDNVFCVMRSAHTTLYVGP